MNIPDISGPAAPKFPSNLSARLCHAGRTIFPSTEDRTRGAFGLNSGRNTPLVSLFAQTAYWAILALGYG
jgi:hypothetical protein